ncbi:MAG TPA: arginine--tRNA ligase [Candidatus Hungatella pullicola]|nr:arginine--tRNA ligase [Candidatus Hungatella pullicola]
MKKILDMITSEMKQAFVDCGYEESYAKVTLSNRPDLCEYQCNGAMAAAKAYKKKPIDIAHQVKEKLADSEMFSLVDAVMPGFINLKLNPQFVADYMNQMTEAEQWGCEKTENPKTIVIDYGGANVAKPLHVGHLRPAIIGESLKRMGRFLGHKVIGDVHLGDFGLQMGLIIEELRDRQPDLVYFQPEYTGEYPAEPPFTIGQLEEIYPCASSKAKEDPEFSARAHEATLKLQKGYAPYRAIWRHIMNVSLPDLKKNYESLDVTFDLWKGESDAEPYIPGLIQELIDKGLAYESQGALVVDIGEPQDPKELPPCIVQKSDGAALYSTSDLGTIIEREKEINPDWYIYVTDKRQELHFIQVFRVAKKAGFVSPDKKMSHLGFGTMNGKDGKPFKTRDGGVMRLEQLIGDITQAAYEKIVENRTVSEEEARETSRMVGMAALKYGDLSNQASKDYVFDIDRFVSFEGNTGPYILYTIVRIKSILSKYEGRADKILMPVSDAEKDLMLQAARYSEVVENSFEELAPHKLCQYIYELSNAFNRFYHDTRILAEENKEQQASWICLIALVKDILTACIDLLGIKAPERM